MARLIGIDEAGLGPVVGPLVATAVTLEVPDELLEADLWACLAGAVGRRLADRSPVVIADSKALYHGPRAPGGLGPLERGVLAALGCLGTPPATMGELLGAVCGDDPVPTPGEPWLDGPDLPLPRATVPGDLAERTGMLRGCLAAAGVRVAAVRSRVVHPAGLNLLLDHHDNKAEAAFEVFAELLGEILETPTPALVHADRLGGRHCYHEHLGRVRGVEWAWILEEGARRSSYRLETAGRPVEVRFTVDGDAAQLPVALASMVSKYIRELHMELLNRFWCGCVPGLEPTAGYFTDGSRFLAEIEPARRRLGITLTSLRRSR